MKKLLNGIANVYLFIALVGMAILVVMMFYEIIMRYFFSSSMVWSHEFFSFLIVWITFMGFGKLIVDREDIMITFLVDKFNPLGKRIMGVFNTLLLLGTAIVMFYYSIQLTMSGFARTTLIMKAPMAWYYIPLALLMALVVLTSIYHVIAVAKGHVDIYHPEEGDHS
ncbi:TRAP transporter small permease [Allobacillus halotolerans]|uniref:TRAP transporter small permease n=1 Tax=Allobacillus halotolerans TaxID=570278 RepID=A0ABS6GTD0_9BACI|nr:TRAP transporter small permease subunit [Allobacillus halotolerans]MBU6081815.1 TRAP transporter small permease [Allobacillus halotolerans]